MNKIIHLSTNADFDNFWYTRVYAGAAATVTINGTSVTMAAGSSLEIMVSSISSVADVYVLGVNKAIAPSVING